MSDPKGSTWWIVSCDGYYRCDAGHTETQRPRRHPVSSRAVVPSGARPIRLNRVPCTRRCRHRTEHLRRLSAVAYRLLKPKRDFGSACAINWGNHREDESRQLQACKIAGGVGSSGFSILQISEGAYRARDGVPPGHAPYRSGGSPRLGNTWPGLRFGRMPAPYPRRFCTRANFRFT